MCNHMLQSKDQTIAESQVAVSSPQPNAEWKCSLGTIGDSKKSPSRLEVQWTVIVLPIASKFSTKTKQNSVKLATQKNQTPCKLETAVLKFTKESVNFWEFPNIWKYEEKDRNSVLGNFENNGIEVVNFKKQYQTIRRKVWKGNR